MQKGIDLYVKEHESSIRNDIRAIADGLEHDPRLFDENRQVRADLLFAKMGTLTESRGLQASYILDSTGHVLGRAKQKFLKDPKPPSASDFADARKGVLLDTPDNGTVTALVQLQSLNDAYLEVVRIVDPQVFGYYLNTKAAVSEYNRLNDNRLEVQLVFAALYTVGTFFDPIMRTIITHWSIISGRDMKAGKIAPLDAPRRPVLAMGAGTAVERVS